MKKNKLIFTLFLEDFSNVVILYIIFWQILPFKKD